MSKHKPTNQNPFISRWAYPNQQSDIIPMTLVITINEMDPIPIPITPKTRFLGLRNKTRPPYSPILFGVNTAQASPQKTDSSAFLMLIG